MQNKGIERGERALVVSKRLRSFTIKARQVVRTGHTDPGQISQKLSYKNDVRSLKFVVVTEPELISLRNDKTVRPFLKNALLDQAVCTPTDRFHWQIEKSHQRPAGYAELDDVGFDRVNASKLTIQNRILHDVQHVSVQHGMDDQKIDRIELIVAEQLTYRTKHVRQRVSRHRANEIIRDLIFWIHATLRFRTTTPPKMGGYPLERTAAR